MNNKMAYLTTTEIVDRTLYYARELEAFGDSEERSPFQEILRTLEDIAIFLEVADRDKGNDPKLLDVANKLHEVAGSAASDALRRGEIVGNGMV